MRNLQIEDAFRSLRYQFGHGLGLFVFPALVPIYAFYLIASVPDAHLLNELGIWLCTALPALIYFLIWLPARGARLRPAWVGLALIEAAMLYLLIPAGMGMYWRIGCLLGGSSLVLVIRIWTPLQIRAGWPPILIWALIVWTGHAGVDSGNLQNMPGSGLANLWLVLLLQSGFVYLSRRRAFWLPLWGSLCAGAMIWYFKADTRYLSWPIFLFLIWTMPVDPVRSRVAQCLEIGLGLLAIFYTLDLFEVVSQAAIPINPYFLMIGIWCFVEPIVLSWMIFESYLRRKI